MEYPIAEVFLAPQGEGFNVGKLMTFVRLAGCTVGKRYPKEMYETDHSDMPMFPIYTNKCTLADGREFPCDTNYQLSKKMDYVELKVLIEQNANGCKEICLTGGEPLMHVTTRNLVEELIQDDFNINLETSGTIQLTRDVIASLLLAEHVCVSPKTGFIPAYKHYAHEFKLLVDDNFDWDTFPFLDQLDINKVFLQPVNYENEINLDNLKLCLKLQKQHPEVRLSLQAHKFWGTR
jgi:organic radical activating enzyme